MSSRWCKKKLVVFKKVILKNKHYQCHSNEGNLPSFRRTPVPTHSQLRKKANWPLENKYTKLTINNLLNLQTCWDKCWFYIEYNCFSKSQCLLNIPWPLTPQLRATIRSTQSLHFIVLPNRFQHCNCLGIPSNQLFLFPKTQNMYIENKTVYI